MEHRKQGRIANAASRERRDKERRDKERSGILLSIKIGLIMPEVSPDPIPWRAVVKNVSPSGMMLEILGLDPATYGVFIKNQRHVIVYLPQDGQASPMELKGKVVWLDYRPQSRPREICCVGLLFDQLNEADTQYLAALVARAAVRPDTSY